VSIIGVAAVSILGLAILAYFAGRSRAVAIHSGDVSLHSRPAYHGSFVALWTLIAGGGVLLVVAVVTAWALKSSLYNALPPEASALANIAVSEAYSTYSIVRSWCVAVLALAAAFIAFLRSYRLLTPLFRARNRTEQIVSWILLKKSARFHFLLERF